MINRRRSSTLNALGLTIVMLGCDNSVRSPLSPSTPTPTARPAPAPATPIASGVLSGVVSELTATGRAAVKGVTVYVLSCGAGNCPASLTVAHEVKTGEDGRYRIAGLYNGSLNFLWIRNDVYELVDPTGTCPDGCDRVVTVNGDTGLDIDLVRR